MKIKTQKLSAILALLAAALAMTAAPALAENLVGNGNSSFDGAIGNGVLSISDDGVELSGMLTVGGQMNDVLVLFIDTGASGGFSTTSGFDDQQDGSREAISGVFGSLRSVLTFTNGFSPKYAMALGPKANNFGGLWRLANGGNNSLAYLTSVNLSPLNTNVGPFSFSVNATNLGLTAGTKASLRIFGTYVNSSGDRSAEAIAGNLVMPAGAGYNPATQTAYANYIFANPQTNNPLVFTVDMKAQLANGSFNPANGDTVWVAGSYQAVPWSGFQLTPEPGHTNLYTGTNQDYNLPGTPELYKFRFYSVANTADTWEFGGPNENRPNICSSGTQVAPTVYFNDWAAHPSATTNAVTFQIDMTAQILLGRFNPANDFVEVAGTFQTNQWTTGFAGFVLTNNPSGANPNLYTGTFPDGNYPGTWQEYKFVDFSLVSGGAGYTNYEYLNNRIFYDPTNSGTLPVAYFNDISPYANPVTFQVDMTQPILAGTFNPGNGDTVGAAGTFQTNQWTLGNSSSGGFVLTNNPTGANSNLYSGTYSVFDQPGTDEQYKFVVNSAGGSELYESPASTGGGNRTFILLTTSQILPAVDWDDTDPNNYLTASTTVTFTVNMTNAVDIFGYPFDPNSDAVVINGDFTSPPFPNFWSDPLLGNFDYSQNLLQNDGSDLLYTGTFTVPAGNALEVQYKYGIIHNYNGTGNTNADNEASPNLNHTRYLRATGTYNFPVDTFGLQQTSLAAATEPSFGSLAISKPVAGQLPITWLGRPGVYLQYTTNLSSGTWVQLNGTGGANSSSWPQTNRQVFFRLVNP